MIYLDTCIVVYAVEGLPVFQQRVRTHVATLEAAGHRFAVSDLVKCEVLVKPFGTDNEQDFLRYAHFFLVPNLTVIPLTPRVYERAARIRGRYEYASGKRYSLADAIHLAAAIESGCDAFLTNDYRLALFPELAMDVLP